ncbi:Fic family protein [Nemorincola caseinilytica]|uniref:Fic family protein n=1 Tax=Nemorincola caseinilytica TaxID=2054315 RepID=A0ABP8NFG1_9BACT
MSSENNILHEIDVLKEELDRHRDLDNVRIQEALAIEYTYESNRIEGNTLTLQETQLIIEKGLTISGKPLREHLEAINHKEAIEYIKQLAQSGATLTEYDLKQIHSIVLRSIDKENAGIYRKVPVMISGSTFLPPQPYLLSKLMEDYFIFYNENKTTLHPVVLAAEMHEQLATIHPFIDGNGRTARLVMNLILLQNDYPIANIKGDAASRKAYYASLEKAQTQNDKSDFIQLIAETEKGSLNKYLSILR